MDPMHSKRNGRDPRGRRRRAGGMRRLLAACMMATLATTACSGDAAAPPDGTALQLELRGLRALDAATEGSYEAWVVTRDGRSVSAGRFVLPADGRVTLTNPVADPASFVLTVEPPSDRDGSPSDLRVLGGSFTNGGAELDVVGHITSGVDLEAAPGTHVLFTPSDNAELGYPSYEDAGIWLFNIRGDTTDGSFFLTFTPLSRGWIYEGWLVRDFGSGEEVWLSYGKFEPDITKKVRARDDTGLGPFSGQLQYRQAMPGEIVFPGDDWLANPHGYPVPGGISLPIDLNGCFRPPAQCAAAGSEYGPSRWTHVITVEPRADLAEQPWMARPFLVRPYWNAIGEGSPDEPREIRYHPEQLPAGTVTTVAG